MLTKNGKFRLQEDAIGYFEKLPLNIQAAIVKDSCSAVGWATEFSIELPAGQGIFKTNIEEHFKDNIEGHQWHGALYNYGFYLSVYNGKTEILQTQIKWGKKYPKGRTFPHSLEPIENTFSFATYCNQLKVYLNKHLKNELPRILISDYPEYMI